MQNSTKIMKSANSFLVLDALRKNGTMTVDALTHSTQLSRPTVLEILEEQTSRHILTSCGKMPSNFGRHPKLYAIDTSHYFAIGIDFEFPPMRLCITDLTGHVCYERQWRCPGNHTNPEIIQHLCQQIKTALEYMSLSIENHIGIGVGISDTVNKRSNISRNISRIPDWGTEPLHELLAQQFPVPIYL